MTTTGEGGVRNGWVGVCDVMSKRKLWNEDENGNGKSVEGK